MKKVGTLQEIGALVGDIVRCVTWYGETYKEGNIYPVVKGFGKGGENIGILHQTLGVWEIVLQRLEDEVQFKEWRHMTDEEKGALLLAKHEGKEIQYLRFDDKWVTSAAFPMGDGIYRVRPEQEVEVTTMYGSPEEACAFFFLERAEHDTHYITFNKVDGEVDCSSVQMRKL